MKRRIIIGQSWLLMWWLGSILSGCAGQPWQLGPASSGPEAGSRLQALRPYHEDFSDLTILWQQVPMEKYCQILTCVRFEGTGPDQDVVRGLKQVLRQVLTWMNVTAIPRPELAVVKRHQTQFLLVQPSLGYQRPRQDEYPLFAQFIKGEYHPVPFRDEGASSQSDDPSSDEESDYLLLVRGDGLTRVEFLSEYETLRLSADPHLIPAQGDYISPQRIVQLLERAYGLAMRFSYDPSQQIIYYQSKKPQSGSKFQWEAEGIYLQRKVNKINMLMGHNFSEVPFQHLVIEMLWQVIMYYENHLYKHASTSMYPDRPVIEIITDQNKNRKFGRVLPIKTIPKQELGLIFSPKPYVLKHRELKLSPEVFLMIYLLEFQAYQMLIQNRDHDVGSMPFFITSEASYQFIEKFKKTQLWQQLSQQFLAGHASQNQRGVSGQDRELMLRRFSATYLMLVAYYYEKIPLHLLEDLEQIMIDHYTMASSTFGILSLLDIDAIDVIDRYVERSKFLKIPVVQILDFLSDDIQQWIAQKQGKHPVSELTQLSQRVESSKRWYNLKRQKMIDLKAYPYYQYLSHDELMVYFLDRLGHSLDIYENYLMRFLTKTQRARCLLDLQYQEDILEYYNMFYVSYPQDKATMICLRVMNIRKEHRRHRL